MQYDFASIMDRRGKDAIAVDMPYTPAGGVFVPAAPKDGFDLIPMWVADMNFPTCPAIVDAIIARAKHPAFGYFELGGVPEAYAAAVAAWHKDRNGVAEVPPEAIGYENGVLGCVASALQAFTAPGEKVLLHSPTYIGFTHTLEDTGRTAELSPLKKDENGVWRMDFADMDRRLKENHIHLAIFCSPHNPCGRVWERREIEKAMEVYAANDCVVVSDEIWSDLILAGHRHIPTQSVSDDARRRTVAVYAPSKTFNLAGLVGSYHIVYDKYLRDRLRRQSAVSHYNGMNVLSMHALLGAYTPEGRQWVDELCATLTGNIDYAWDFITQNFAGVTAARPQGTYMMYLHCEDWCRAHGKTMEELLKAGWDVGVAWQDGRPFHDDWAIRMNFALPFARVQEAMRRLKEYVL